MSNSLSQPAETALQKRQRVSGGYIDFMSLGRAKLPQNNHSWILSCGVNERNPKNKVSLFFGDLKLIVRDTLAIINTRFHLTLNERNEIGEVIIKNHTRHFSCRFFIPIENSCEFCVATDTGLYSHFMSKVIYTNENHARYKVAIISSPLSSEAYLLITDVMEGMFFYGTFLLADKKVRTYAEEVAHAAEEIVKHFPSDDD